LYKNTGVEIGRINSASRRESRFRKHGDVPVSTNRHTITPIAWVQEKEKYKTVPAGKSPY